MIYFSDLVSILWKKQKQFLCVSVKFQMETLWKEKVWEQSEQRLAYG